MANKKYTLYFKGINKYGHEHNFPILNLDLKSMDIYTSNYKNYKDLFNQLPNDLKEFIKENLCDKINIEKDKDLEESFFITDNDFNPIMDIIFEDNVDVLYVEQKELENLLIDKLMTIEEFQKAILNTMTYSNLKTKYQFFSYLYNTYVKNSKVRCMIDDYEVKKYNLNLTDDDIIIASIATDKDNLKVLSKKLSQTLESRRNLAFEFKKVFKNDSMITDFKYILRKISLDLNSINLNINENLLKFKKEYEKQYKTTI